MPSDFHLNMVYGRRGKTTIIGRSLINFLDLMPGQEYSRRMARIEEHIDVSNEGRYIALKKVEKIVEEIGFDMEKFESELERAGRTDDYETVFGMLALVYIRTEDVETYIIHNVKAYPWDLSGLEDRATRAKHHKIREEWEGLVKEAKEPEAAADIPDVLLLYLSNGKLIAPYQMTERDERLYSLPGKTRRNSGVFYRHFPGMDFREIDNKAFSQIQDCLDAILAEGDFDLDHFRRLADGLPESKSELMDAVWPIYIRFLEETEYTKRDFSEKSILRTQTL